MYSLYFHNRAKKELSKIARPHQIIIKRKLLILSKNPDSLKNQIKRLRGQKKDLYRLRVGSFRIIYQKRERELIILIIRIGHRKEIYE
jgi:mRNA interferase RelE/StbE